MTNEELLELAARAEAQTAPSLDELLFAVRLATQTAQEATGDTQRMLARAGELAGKYAQGVAYELTVLLLPFRLETDAHATDTLKRLIAALTDGAS